MFGLKSKLLPVALVAAGLAASLTVLAAPSESYAGNRNGIKRRIWPHRPHRPVFSPLVVASPLIARDVPAR